MKNFKRTSIALLTAIYITVDVFGSLLLMGPVKAIPTEVTADVPATTKEVKDEIGSKILSVLRTSAMGVLINAVSYFSRKLSHDTAIYIASGGKGQGALIFKDGIGRYMENVALDTVGEAVGSLGQPFGLNLCQIPNPKLDISLRISLQSLYPNGTEPKPKCSWQELQNSWGNIGNVMEKRYGPGGGKFVSETFNANLSVSQSDFGIALDAMAKLDNLYYTSKEVAEAQRIANQGIKDVESKISGNILTPSPTLTREFESLTAAEQSEFSGEQISGLYGTEIENVAITALNVFLNTLVSSLLTNVMTGLFSDTPDTASKLIGGGLASGASSFFASSPQDNKKSAERVYNFLNTPTITQVDDYKTIDQLFAAKAIDTGMQQAVSRGSNLETMMTIGEALELNFLHANWALIPSTHPWNSNVEKDCYTKAYCFSNIQKLRKARILPIGFELAASKSGQDEPYTLGKVVDGFDDCNSSGEADRAHPFCHLIDPNWVLKAPEARCQSEAVGPELIKPGINKRQTECMDLQTCISKSDDGTCNYWGYCTKEENVWRLGGESCPDYYSTCTTYQNTSTKQTASYLSRTVDFSQCDVKSVGCQAYSSEQVKDPVTGDWNWATALTVNGEYKGYGRNQMAYFNRNVETCSADAEGCSAFYGAQRDINTGVFTTNNPGTYIRDSANLIHLKKAPDYLSCYDTITTGGLVIDWPKSKTEVLKKIDENDPRCNEFAQVCAQEEVGCSLFTPTAGGSNVTAIVDIDNTCSKECIGYESFKQEESNFEGGKFPMYFIPNLGKACSIAAVGCSEFTNLSSTAGGESLVYYSYARLCEKPNGLSEKSFVSWEGSESEGYVLRNHLLKTMNVDENNYVSGLGLTYSGGDSLGTVFPIDSPSYGDNTRLKIQDNYNKCNAVSYALLITNPFVAGAAHADCRQLFDSSGNVFYRILKETVVIDESCQQLRKTDVNLFVDTSIATSGTCTSQGGYWDTSVGASCKRCYGGGQVTSTGDACFYSALPSESASCQSIDNGCRAYTGNSGNNIRPDIIFDTFEGDPATAVVNWTAGTSVSAESLQTGQHSLKVNSVTVERTIPVGTIDSTNSLNQNGWYELSFWARGAPRNLSIDFNQGGNRGLFTVDPVDPANGAGNPITVGNDWQEYRLGPVQFTGLGNQAVTIRFTTVGANLSAYFIDNFNLSQVEGSIYLVKDSWRQLVDFNGEQVLANAPGACYMGLDPRTSLPGAALGCREYKDESSNIYYLTSFSSLCREAAVGCQPMFESNNTVGEVLATVYNAVCTGTVGNCELNFGGSTGTCYIPAGETKCYVPKITLPVVNGQYMLLSDLPGPAIDISTVYVPPENAIPVYLTNTTQYQCGAEQRGCTLFGLQDQTIPTEDNSSYKYTNTYILNNPDQYETVLCRQDLIGCNEYVSGANAYYFRDPTETGNYTCVYKADVDGVSGWFKNNIGACSNDDTILCKEDSNCNPTGSTNYTCTKIGEVPCYPNYLQEDNYYNIWSNKSVDYEGFVGVCEAKYSGCTEFIDPQDTSTLNMAGKSYYKIFDNRLTANVADCQGQVSLKEGCILFDNVNQPTKLYNTQQTYAASDNAEQKYSLVNPIASTLPGVPNNANVILKVNRDRECSEWLACKSPNIIFNERSGKKEALCSNYQACDKIKVGGGQQSQQQGCAHSVEPALGETFLDESLYVDRDVSWYGFDYSGYSILQKHQIGGYTYLTFNNDTKHYLGATIWTPSYAGNECESTTGVNLMGNPCGNGSSGRCYGSECIYRMDGEKFEDVDVVADSMEVKLEKMRKGLLPATCKAYPEDTAPFPYHLAVLPPEENIADADIGQKSVIKVNGDEKRNEFIIANDDFAGVNICQLDSEDCSCGYKKYTYGSGSSAIDYYPVSTTTYALYAPKGVCISGDKTGVPCEKDLDCQVVVNGNVESSGSCDKLKKIETKLGLFGFCLEPDLSRPVNGLAKFGRPQEYACQTWLPIQTSASNIDLYNLYTGAGYDPVLDAERGTVTGEMYCANSLQGGIVDTSATDFSTLQQRINTGKFSSSEMSVMFEEPFYSYDCRLNSAPACEAEGCIDTSDPWTFVAGLIGGLFAGTAGALIGITIVTLLRGNPNYNIGTAGAAFFHAICPQYDVVYNQMSPAEQTTYSSNLLPTVYDYLQTWAWNKIGPNAVVIRAEYGVNEQYLDDGSGITFTGFAPVNNSNTQTISAAENSSIGREGHHSFAQANQLITEENIKNIYFIPLNLKGTVRGIVPRQINTLTGGESPLTDGDEYLKLPLKDMRTPGFVNGNMTGFKSAYIRHFQDSWGFENGNRGDKYMENRVINFTGDESNFKVAISTAAGHTSDSTYAKLIYNLDTTINHSLVNESNRDAIDCNYGQVNPLLVWRYRIDNPSAVAQASPYFEAGVTTKYVLSWFVNDTEKLAFTSSPSGNKCYRDQHAYDPQAPNFVDNYINNFKSGSNRTAVPGVGGYQGDPFTAACQTGYADVAKGNSDNDDYDFPRYNPWFAVAVNFDANHNFVGFTTRWCDAVGIGDTSQGGMAGGPSSDEWTVARRSHRATPFAGMNYAVIVELETQCTDFITVEDRSASPGVTRNKAWTNRTWVGAKNNNDTPLNHPYTNYGSVINRGTQRLGFGSLRGFEPSTNYYLIDRNADGVPYACSQVLNSGTVGNGNLSGTNMNMPCGFPINNSNYRTWPSYVSVVGSKNISQAQTAISNLFALFVNRRAINATVAPLLGLGTASGPTDFSVDIHGAQPLSITGQAEYLLPPRVFSINPFTCPIDSGSGTCTAGDADNITINQINGIASTKDYNGDGAFSPEEALQTKDIIAFESLEANARFFAYADDNHMPIRKVTVNWGDGIGTSDDITNMQVQGYYKNSKPFCASDSNGLTMSRLCKMRETSLTPSLEMPSGLTCRENQDCPKELLGGLPGVCLTEDQLNNDYPATTYGASRFGNAARACVAQPFEFVHNYTCSTSNPYRVLITSILDSNIRTRITEISATATHVCVFKPRVQIIDNWGYCNGRCGDAAGPGGIYCYSPDTTLGNNGPAMGTGECKWPDFSTLNVTPTTPTPYTEYQGNIYIIAAP